MEEHALNHPKWGLQRNMNKEFSFRNRGDRSGAVSIAKRWERGTEELP